MNLMQDLFMSHEPNWKGRKISSEETHSRYKKTQISTERFSKRILQSHYVLRANWDFVTNNTLVNVAQILSKNPILKDFTIVKIMHQ